MPARVEIRPESAPVLARHVKLRFDSARAAWVLLAPERVLMPDETALTVLRRLDGTKTVAAIADELAGEYDAPPEAIAADVIEMLQDLADKDFLRA